MSLKSWFQEFWKNLTGGNFSVSSDGSLDPRSNGERSAPLPHTSGADFVQGLFGFPTSDGNSPSIFGALTNFLNAMSGEHMTNAEVERNQMQMQNAEDIYQRQVTGMQNAGLNPALMYGNGTSSAPSAPTAQSPGMNMSDLLQMVMIKPQMQLLKTQAENVAADSKLKIAQANKTETDTIANQQYNEWFKDTYELRKRALELANTLTGTQERAINKQMEVFSEQISTMKSEQAKNYAAAILDKANAHRVATMIPYEIALTQAQTENQKAQALLAAVNQAYQQHLIDDGYLEAFTRDMQERANDSEQKARLDKIRADIRSGTFVEKDYSGNWFDDSANWFARNLASPTIQGLVLFMDNLNPLAGFVK